MIAAVEDVWTFDPVAVWLAALALYTQGFVRLRRRAGAAHADAWRAALGPRF